MDGCPFWMPVTTAKFVRHFKLYHYYNHDTTTMIWDILRIMASVIFQSLSYLMVPALMVSSLSSGSQWFCLTGIVSTVVMSIITSHINNSDAYNILMQFVFWLTGWGILGWFQSMYSYTSPRDTINTFVAVEGIQILFPFQDLPAWLRSTIIIISSFFSIVFLEIVFYSIIGHSGGNLGMFGKLHTAIWEWAQFAWSEVREMWDIAGNNIIVLFGKLCRICGVRDRQVADQEAHLGGPGIISSSASPSSSPFGFLAFFFGEAASVVTGVDDDARALASLNPGGADASTMALKITPV
jgi:hypothetical protein